MKKHNLQNNIVYLIFGLLLSIPLVVSAQAPPRLEVVFTPEPLFSKEGVLPGDSASGTITVTNNSGDDQTIITEAINFSDPDELSGQMTLTITDDEANTFFDVGDGTFLDFLTGGIKTLTDPLSNGGSIEYTFEVSFLEGAENAYQNTEFEFDLCVGFLDEIDGINCGDTVVSGEGNTDEEGEVSGDSGGAVGGSAGGGGGGIINTTPLTISDEQVEELDIDVQTALIVWDTNLYSTSQVVYGLASGGPYSISLLEPNFGYPLATIETFVKVLHHEVLLEGLIPGEAYSYRVVSRASPPTISFEHTFDFEEPAPPAAPDSGGSGGGSGGSQGSGGSGGSGDQGPLASFGSSLSSFGSALAQAIGIGEEDTGVRTSDDLLREFAERRQRSESSSPDTSGGGLAVRDPEFDTYTSNNIAAAALGIEGDFLGVFVSGDCLFISALSVLFIFVVWGLLVLKNRRRYTRETRLRYRRLYFPLAFTSVLISAYIFGYLCIVLPLSAALLLSILWAFMDGLRDED